MADRSKAWRKMPFRIVVGAFAVVTAAWAQADTTLALLSDTQPVEIRIVSTEFQFTPARIRVTAGHAVMLVLDNSGAETEHNVSVPAFGFRLQARPGEIAQKSFVFDKPGEYEFSCDLPAHREAGMKGKLIVR